MRVFKTDNRLASNQLSPRKGPAINNVLCLGSSHWHRCWMRKLFVRYHKHNVACYSLAGDYPTVHLLFFADVQMRVMADLRILAPKALLLNAESNERDPHTSMKIMGEKLAKEVHRWGERACRNNQKPFFKCCRGKLVVHTI